ncbi:Polyadenylate-binding protein-interacting protein 4 [Sesamum angolense]|uniref:Polyadenylate-binding protein-interacting protein 4 n=1 Tax=Sesamum angolense TaxID=2727404 RepID=A0AAE1WL33_9LAMI|nr:Polyadenylate-binding protein-interacting protein 4 [Sesamum angolense]
MNMQQVVKPRPSPNGYGRHKIEKDTATRFDSKFQIGKTTSGLASFGRVLESNSRDRLIYATTCLIGHPVEVQVLDGSVFSGIFHATNAEDFGIILKMAHSAKDGSGGQKSISDSHTRPSRTLIIPAEDLVQVIAKGVPVTRDGFTNELQNETQLELMTDSCISQSRYVEVGRELEHWVPDENDPGCPELDNIFDGPWNRGWDQFEANETLFGVKSTFNEDLYTTKLERGPQMRELEREALRIAREIEGEDTLDFHLAEERGIQLDGYLEMDEETRFSSVYRGADDSGYDEIEDILLDSRNNETFGGVSGSLTGETLVDRSAENARDETQLSSRSSLLGEVQYSLTSTSRDAYHSGSEDHALQMLAEQLPKSWSVVDACRYPKEDEEKQKAHDQSQVSKADDSHSFLIVKKENCDKIGLSPNVTASDPAHASSKGQEKVSSSNELSEGAAPPTTQGTRSSLACPSSSASTSDRGGATSTSAGRGLSPSSSVCSLSSEKSTLNPHAKEFRLNPNAKSFIPSPAPLRPSSPVADGPFYYPANMTAPAHMHAVPVGIGYGQQIIMGQPRPVLYVPSYPPVRKLFLPLIPLLFYVLTGAVTVKKYNRPVMTAKEASKEMPWAQCGLPYLLFVSIVNIFDGDLYDDELHFGLRIKWSFSSSPSSPAVSFCLFQTNDRMEAGYNPRTVEEVFRDFKGRRAGLIKALTTDVEEFFQQCDPGRVFFFRFRVGNSWLFSCFLAFLSAGYVFAYQLLWKIAINFIDASILTLYAFISEKDNLCLYGFPSEQWEVNLPAEEVPPELPEPALGINFARDGMQEKDWLSLVAVHSDACCLLSPSILVLDSDLIKLTGGSDAFHLTSSHNCFHFVPKCPHLVNVALFIESLDHLEELILGILINSFLSVFISSYGLRTSETQVKMLKSQPKDEEEGLDEEEEDEHGETLCGACGENYASDEFWICCDMCEKWFHGKCVKITPARAEHIKQYKCPSCSNKRPRP